MIAFPHGAIINLTSNINPPTKTISYWFDFYQYRFYKEFQKLKNLEIDVIAIIKIDENAWSVHERLFRPEDKVLVQRKIQKLLLDRALQINIQDFMIFIKTVQK